MTALAKDPDLKTLIEEVIPFNKLLGVKVVAADSGAGTVVLELPMRHDLIGNVMKAMPHGGAISALIDMAAGAAAALSLEDLRDAPGVATIDMRVDYLAAGRGTNLRAKATVMRSGRRVTVVRVDVTDDDATLLALGTAAFSITTESHGSALAEATAADRVGATGEEG